MPVQRRIITLLTDFGNRDSYIAQMKGVLLGKIPDAQIVDQVQRGNIIPMPAQGGGR